MPGVSWESKFDVKRMLGGRKANVDTAADGDRKLLFFLIKDGGGVKLDLEGAAAAISTPGVTCTATAVASRIKKLRRLAKDEIVECVIPLLREPVFSTRSMTDSLRRTKTPSDDDEGVTSMKSKDSKKDGKRAAAAWDEDDNDKESKPPAAKKARKTAAGKAGNKSKSKKAEMAKEEQDVEDSE